MVPVEKTTRGVVNNQLEATMSDYLRYPDERHLHQVVRAASRLVNHFAHLYAPGRLKEDVLQAGFEGLIKSVKRYDPKRCTAFATYASHCIMGEIRHYIRKETAYYRPGWAANIQGKADRFIEEYMKQTGHVPEMSEIAVGLNIREEGVIQAMQAGLVSFDEIELAEIRSLRYESFRLPVEDIIVLEQALAKLPEIQRRVVQLLFYQDKTQNEVAEELGINQRKVSRILQKSLKTMAEFISAFPKWRP